MGATRRIDRSVHPRLFLKGPRNVDAGATIVAMVPLSDLGLVLGGSLAPLGCCLAFIERPCAEEYLNSMGIDVDSSSFYGPAWVVRQVVGWETRRVSVEAFRREGGWQT